MSLFGSIIGLILGIVLVVKGGDAFVEAASNLAKALGLPTFLIGVTVVSLATTLPEILVSILAAAQGKAEMAVGNALGSVTANTGLVLACGMLALPGIALGKGVRVPCALLLLASGILWLACLNGALAPWGCVVLALLCAVFFATNIRSAAAQPKDSAAGNAGAWVWKFLLGAAGIVAGSQFLISGGEGLARNLGVPERVIAVTLLAVGTGLPELVTTLTAVKKGEAALSVGNILGANLIDMTLILPLCSLAAPGQLPISSQTLAVDFPGCFAILAVATLPMLLWKKCTRLQGAVLLALYLGFLIGLL